MTSLAESVGRENIPEPAAKLQKLSPPPEPPLLVKKLSEHATIPARGSAKAAGYDLSRRAGEQNPCSCALLTVDCWQLQGTEVRLYTRRCSECGSVHTGHAIASDGHSRSPVVWCMMGHSDC